MTTESMQTGDENFLHELDDPRLRAAVELVRQSSVPVDAANRAASRADIASSAAGEVHRRSTELKPASRRLAKMAVAVGVIWMMAAGAWTFVETANEAREVARNSTVKNSMQQLGMAMHNYSDVGVSGRVNIDDMFGLPQGTIPGRFDTNDYVGINGVWDNSLSMNFGSTGDGLGVFFDNGRIRNSLDGLTNTFMMGEEGKAGARFAQPDAAVAFSPDGKMISTPQKKIIQSAYVSLIVKELAAAETELSGLVQKHQAEIANAQVAQTQGQQRAARWIIRVKAASLDELLKDIVNLGIAEARSVNADDVTEEYIDLESRIASKKKLEQRILEVLEKKAGDIKDVLAVEEQLARIRTEIESMEGRRKYLDSMTAMSTVTVVAREQAEYIPPEVDSFTNQVDRAWGGSLDMIKNVGKSLVLVAVAAGPWLPIAVVLCFGVFRMFKRWRTAKG